MSKYVLEPYDYLTAQSLNADFNSVKFECFAYYGLVIQLNVTVTTDISGTIKVQHSAEKEPVNWIDSTIFTPITYTALATNTVSAFVTQGIIPWKWLRLSWDNTAGTGSVAAIIDGVRV